MKSRKDRAQAELIIRALADDRPDELREAYETALQSGPRWQERLTNSLARVPHVAELLDKI